MPLQSRRAELPVRLTVGLCASGCHLRGGPLRAQRSFHHGNILQQCKPRLLRVRCSRRVVGIADRFKYLLGCVRHFRAAEQPKFRRAFLFGGGVSIFRGSSVIQRWWSLFCVVFLVGGVSIQQQWSNLSRGVIIRCGRVIFWDG